VLPVPPLGGTRLKRKNRTPRIFHGATTAVFNKAALKDLTRRVTAHSSRGVVDRYIQEDIEAIRAATNLNSEAAEVLKISSLLRLLHSVERPPTKLRFVPLPQGVKKSIRSYSVPTGNSTLHRSDQRNVDRYSGEYISYVPFYLSSN